MKIMEKRETYIAAKAASHSRKLVRKPELASLTEWLARFRAAVARSFRSDLIKSLLGSLSVLILK